MIYEYPDESEPIRQGDIFVALPRVELSLLTIPVVDDNNLTSLKRWDEIAEARKELTAVLSLRSVPAIVATQDCDALRSRDITLCEIRPFRQVERATCPHQSEVVLLTSR